MISNFTLSPRFNGHFPGEPGIAGVYCSKGWWRWWWQLDYWSYKSCNVPAKLSPPTNQHPVFYRPDALPVAQPTVSKHRREKYHIPWTCLPQAHWGVFQLCLWPLIAPGYLGGGLTCLSSALWCQYPRYQTNTFFWYQTLLKITITWRLFNNPSMPVPECLNSEYFYCNQGRQKWWQQLEL